jgi:hypothetical protein
MRDPEIEVECRSCGRSGTFIRADILKKHGASITFAKLRRIAAMGCDRLTGPDGDQCQTRFPCLDETKLPTAKNHILA